MKTSQAEAILIGLSAFSDVKGKVGVRLARNKRMIEDELMDYLQFKNDLFVKYGELQNGSYVINKLSDNFEKFLDELRPLEDEEVEFDFRTFTDADLEEAELTMDQCDFIMRYFYDNEN